MRAAHEKAEQAALAAVASPLLETSINGATGVLVNVCGSAELTLDDVETAAGIVQEAANPEANIIFGATYSDDLEDEIQVTVIATGFDHKEEPKPKTGFAASIGDISEIDDVLGIFNKK